MNTKETYKNMVENGTLSFTLKKLRKIGSEQTTNQNTNENLEISMKKMLNKSNENK